MFHLRKSSSLMLYLTQQRILQQLQSLRCSYEVMVMLHRFDDLKRIDSKPELQRFTSDSPFAGMSAFPVRWTA